MWIGYSFSDPCGDPLKIEEDEQAEKENILSKSIALALAITETASVSFHTTGKPLLDKEIWNKLLESSNFQSLVYANLKPSKNWFGMPNADSLPNIEDFRELKVEFGRRLDLFSSWDSVRAKFLMLEAERVMADRVPDGLFAEMMYDFILEDCEEYLRGGY